MKYSNVVAAAEVKWYRQNGKYPDKRIVRDSRGGLYVIGDFSWNVSPNPPEYIEQAMQFAGILA